MPFQFRKEAIEEDLNTNFPSQGQGNPPLYYSLSEVVVPTYSINSVAEGSGLPQNLQTAWDFSTGHSTVANTTTTIISNTGFWLLDVNCSIIDGAAARSANINITDGLGSKIIWEVNIAGTGLTGSYSTVTENKFVVFVRSGDSIRVTTDNAAIIADVWYRQIATVNGTLVNPLGFSFA